MLNLQRIKATIADQKTHGDPAACLSYFDVMDLIAEIERTRAALKPFADAVYNDNGDMTVTPVGIDEYASAYFVMRSFEQKGVEQ